MELLVKQQGHQAATGNAQGLYPFQVAVESDARLDVIFCLIKDAPNALNESASVRQQQQGQVENSRPGKKRRRVDVDE
jgi:hypothetical protein